MSTVTTYLVIVFTLTGDMIRATSYFGEEDVRRELDTVGIHWQASRKEIHLIYEIEPPLEQMVLDRLIWMKNMGMCTNFYVRDEISSGFSLETTAEGQAFRDTILESDLVPDEDDEDVTELNQKLGIDVRDEKQLKAYWQRAIDDLKG
jgi:hypothetical protein